MATAASRSDLREAAGDESAAAAPVCARCGWSRGVAYSYRLSQSVCWRCHHGSFTPDEIAEAERVELQARIASAIRGAGADARQRGKLADRALLIETAPTADEVVELLDEVERLGVAVERP